MLVNKTTFFVILYLTAISLLVASQTHSGSIPNCLTYASSGTTCVTCEQGHTLSDDQTACIKVSNCSAFAHCSACTSTACSSCQGGYLWVGSECVACYKIDNSWRNCIVSNGVLAPSTCWQGYFLTADRCQICTVIDSYCYACSSQGCTTCYVGYYLNPQSQCAPCSSKCLACSSSNTCTNCKSGYYVDSFNSCSSCASVNPNWTACSSPSTAITCAVGTYLSNGRCASCGQINAAWLTCTPKRPITCLRAYYLQTSNLSCVYCPSINAKWTTCSNQSTPLSCIQGYYVNQGQCLACNSINTLWASCDNCIEPTKCIKGYFVDKGTCKPCSGVNPIWSACQSSTVVTSCVAQYLAINSTSCVRCGSVVANCWNCSHNNDSTIRCTKCLSGFYPDSASSCATCSSMIPNCWTCSANGTGVIKCDSCMPSYYLPGVDICFPCSQFDTNCFLCNNMGRCTQCLLGYYVDSAYRCQPRPSCLVLNCLTCTNNDENTCLNCKKDFILQVGGAACLQPSCPITGMFFDGQACSCPNAYYSNNASCSPCSNYCVSCSDSSTCTLCQIGFYLSSGSCVSCQSNCMMCDASSCIFCDLGYYLLDSVCVNSPFYNLAATRVANQVTLCPTGCKSCRSGLLCTSCQRGYVLTNSSCLQCNQSCLTCSSTKINECLSCTAGLYLFSGACLTCTDKNCLNCAKNYQFCATCQQGFISEKGACLSCAKNCIRCQNRGPGFCDLDSCAVGYTRVRPDACGQCFLGCSRCSPTDLSVCLSCAQGTYPTSNSSCLPCPSGCYNCSSGFYCSTCLQGYQLSNGNCLKPCAFPCATCGPSRTCMACFKGYSLTNGSCFADLNCNNTTNCTVCPLGYVLDSQVCKQCSGSNCLGCTAANLSECTLCSAGSYLASATKSCVPCEPACLICQSSSVCLSCADGFFMLTINDQITGNCQPCDKNCASCLESSTRCLTCPIGFSLVALKCVSDINVGFLFTFSKPSVSSVVNQMSTFVKFTQEIRSSLASHLGDAYAKDKSLISFTRLTSGSVNLEGKISVASGQDPSSVLSRANSIPMGSQHGGFGLVSASLVANGFVSVSQQLNLGTILSWTIPVIVGLGVTTIYLIVRCRRKQAQSQQVDLGTPRQRQVGKQHQDKYKQEEDKYIQQQVQI